MESYGSDHKEDQPKDDSTESIGLLNDKLRKFFL